MAPGQKNVVLQLALLAYTFFPPGRGATMRTGLCYFRSVGRGLRVMQHPCRQNTRGLLTTVLQFPLVTTLSG